MYFLVFLDSHCTIGYRISGSTTAFAPILLLSSKFFLVKFKWTAQIPLNRTVLMESYDTRLLNFDLSPLSLCFYPVPLTTWKIWWVCMCAYNMIICYTHIICWRIYNLLLRNLHRFTFQFSLTVFFLILTVVLVCTSMNESDFCVCQREAKYITTPKQPQNHEKLCRFFSITFWFLFFFVCACEILFCKRCVHALI